MTRLRHLGIGIALCASVGPRAASGCPHGSSASSSSTSSSSGGRAAASVFSALFAGGARSTSRGYSPGGFFSSEPLALIPMELSVAASARTLNLSDTQVSGWDEHPLLENYVYGASQVSGTRLGLARANFGGVTLRLNTLIGGRLTLGILGGVYAQTNQNLAAPESDGQLRARRGWMYEAGAELGGIVPLGPVTLRGGVFAGYRGVQFQLDGIGNAGCTTIPVIRNDTVVLAPRMQVDYNITPNLSVGVVASLDVVTRDDLQAGLVFGWHARGYSLR